MVIQVGRCNSRRLRFDQILDRVDGITSTGDRLTSRFDWIRGLHIPLPPGSRLGQVHQERDPHNQRHQRRPKVEVGHDRSHHITPGASIGAEVRQ